MTLRPVAARWFEVLTDREHLGEVLECLASTRSVELEVTSASDSAGAVPDYREVLAEYGELARRYAAYWPEPRVDAAVAPPQSLAGARDALKELRGWAADADAPISRLEALVTEEAGLAEIERVFRAAGAELPSLAAVSQAGPVLAARLYVAEKGAITQLPAAMLALELDLPSNHYRLCVGEAAEVAALDREVAAAHGRAIPLPQGLPADPAAALAELDSRRRSLAGTRREVEQELATLASRHALAARLAGFRFLEWLVEHVPRLPATEHFAYVTGWTRDLGGGVLEKALTRAGLPNLLHFPEPPRTLEAPIVLDNPAWLRPFEAFVGLLGTPGAAEADPTPLVAIIAPLLFGYMFGDVGQGLTVAVVGAALWRRAPALRLLVPGGLAAAVFGVAFGSVFAREDLIRALWLRPLSAPLTMLAVSVGFGAVVLLVGFVLEAAEHVWARQASRWAVRRGGLLVLYVALLLSPFERGALALAGAGLLWTLLAAGAAERSLAAVGSALGELLESALQLLVNTISFARVGAFALAHAGLAAAVVGLAAAAPGAVGRVAALILGNLLILVLEGLVVGIQTTRLVLFEFFVRFLKAEGRPFHPLPEPTASSTKESP
jgi:V/A-type H+-transporting ATPase subunit I